MKSSRFRVFRKSLSVVSNAFESFLENLLNLVTDTECIVCGSPSHGKRLCTECALVIDGPPAVTTKRIGTASVHYFGFYEERLREFIISYKFKNHHSLAKAFAKMLYSTIQSNKLSIDLITYVPATRSAKKKRGYDHMRLIAKELEVISGLPSIDALRAVRETDQLLTNDRAEAVKGKFALTDNSTYLNGKKVLLIDDVLTTGNTMLEAAKILKGAKPKEIYLCVIALNRG
ncbi:ComF family protein [Fervidobacterium changbaicum]|nr:phosphoribosyltransferase family protein [Fervidobacterium changbaicum]